MNWNNLEDIKKDVFNYLKDSYDFNTRSNKTPWEIMKYMKNELHKAEGVTTATVLYPKLEKKQRVFLKTCEIENCYNNYQIAYGKSDIDIHRKAYLVMFEIIEDQLNELRNIVLKANTF